MRIALIGYGKMGRAIEGLAEAHGGQIVARIEQGDEYGALDGADVAIEFTHPSSAVASIVECAERGLPIVVGTTGWFDALPEVREIIGIKNSALVYGANFSIGVNLFARIVREAAKQFASRPEYEAWAYEMHHSAKVDAPSGTLLKLVDLMRDGGYEAHVDVASNRAGKVPGTHEIGFDSAADTVTLRHVARSREGFATGALHAAKWIIGKQGVYEFGETL
jgi:4-hydroxy-tetrahydrodipicolinate reductase